jgi:NADH:ubiquinone oxidoreductase subunit C
VKRPIHRAADLRESRNSVVTHFLRLFNDITSIDNSGGTAVRNCAWLYSMPLGVHLRFKLRVSEDVGAIDTISDIWPTANWHERDLRHDGNQV